MGAVCSLRCLEKQCEGPQKEINMFRFDGNKSKYAVEGRCPFSGNGRGVELEDVPKLEKTRFGTSCSAFYV